MMTTILCFGDSNTWGYSPCAWRRFSRSERWPAILATLLPDHCEIVESGQPGRTTVHDDPFEDVKNGRRVLRPLLESHHPDIVVLLLGTNDLKSRFGLSAADISRGAARLVEDIQGFSHRIKPATPRVLLVAPPPVHECGVFAEMFAGAAAKSLEFDQYYRRRAKELRCDYLNAGEFVVSSERDGIHWEVEQHALFAQGVAKKLLTMI